VSLSGGGDEHGEDVDGFEGMAHVIMIVAREAADGAPIEALNHRREPAPDLIIIQAAHRSPTHQEQDIDPEVAPRRMLAGADDEPAIAQRPVAIGALLAEIGFRHP